MTHDVYFQFLQTPQQLRRRGASGGKATARNRRERRGAARRSNEPQGSAVSHLQRETTAAAIALLDTTCPWLRGVEKRFSN